MVGNWSRKPGYLARIGVRSLHPPPSSTERYSHTTTTATTAAITSAPSGVRRNESIKKGPPFPQAARVRVSDASAQTGALRVSGGAAWRAVFQMAAPCVL